MTTIDWTKPVHDAREIHVEPLFDSNGRIQACVIGSVVYAHPAFEKLGLRNVAPPKPQPVLLEGWLNLYSDRNIRPTMQESKPLADYLAREGRVECRRIAWMSDGSPVPGEASGEEPDLSAMSILHMEKQGLAEQRDHWKAKAEALQAEVARMRPVVDAAVEWKRSWLRNEPVMGLLEAVRAYQEKTNGQA